MLRDIIIHGISAETDICENTSEARNEEIREGTVDSYIRKENVSHGTSIRNLVNTTWLHCAGFLNYVRDKFVSCKQMFKIPCKPCIDFVRKWWY